MGRSTFYTHFRDKDDLLETGIDDILRPIPDQRPRGSAVERMLAFSLPLLKHIDEHRRAAGPKIKREGRVVMHRHMQRVLTDLIADDLARVTAGGPKGQIPTDLMAQYVASTFVLVLNWWVESDPAPSPAEVDVFFRDLVLPALTTLTTCGR